LSSERNAGDVLEPLTIRYQPNRAWQGGKVPELKPGMTAISVSKREESPDAIR
jgi:hypothetical protein